MCHLVMNPAASFGMQMKMLELIRSSNPLSTFFGALYDLTRWAGNRPVDLLVHLTPPLLALLPSLALALYMRKGFIRTLEKST